MPRCSKCGRPLSNPTSIARGMGPICAKKQGVRAVRYNTNEKEPEVEAHPITGKPKVFISFHVADKNMVELLRYQAKESDQLEFSDYSVQEPFDEKWKTNCTERMQKADILVVAIGEETHTREAVLWEINRAYELGKPVFGMRIHSDKNHIIPKPLVEHHAEILEWKLEAIQAKLDEIKEQSQRGVEINGKLAYA